MTGYTPSWKLPYPDNYSAAADSPAAFKALADAVESAITRAYDMPYPGVKEGGNAAQTITRRAAGPLPTPVEVSLTAPANTVRSLLVHVTGHLWVSAAAGTPGYFSIGAVAGSTFIGTTTVGRVDGDYRSVECSVICSVAPGTAAKWQLLAYKGADGAVTANYIRLRAIPLGWI